MQKCIICGHNQEKFLTGTDFWLKTTNRMYSLVKCKACGLETISPIPDTKEISSFYKEDYYSYSSEKAKKDIHKNIDTIMHKIYCFLGISNKYLDITYYKEGKGKKFLDVGCGNGEKVNLMGKNGYISEGFEIGNQGKIKDIFYGESITDINFRKRYDLILCSHVFEHVITPIEFLDKIKDLLNDNGQCIILLPNVGSLSSKLFKQYALERDIPRHMFNYNYKNFQKLLIKAGYKIHLKRKTRQAWFFSSLRQYIQGEHNIDIAANKIIRYIVAGCCVFIIEIILSCIKNTNSMGFIISKK